MELNGKTKNKNHSKIKTIGYSLLLGLGLYANSACGRSDISCSGGRCGEQKLAPEISIGSLGEYCVGSTVPVFVDVRNPNLEDKIENNQYPISVSCTIDGNKYPAASAKGPFEYVIETKGYSENPTIPVNCDAVYNDGITSLTTKATANFGLKECEDNQLRLKRETTYDANGNVIPTMPGDDIVIRIQDYNAQKAIGYGLQLNYNGQMLNYDHIIPSENFPVVGAHLLEVNNPATDITTVYEGTLIVGGSIEYGSNPVEGDSKLVEIVLRAMAPGNTFVNIDPNGTYLINENGEILNINLDENPLNIRISEE